jgi:hypothetical protein
MKKKLKKKVEYKTDKLRIYVENSELRIVNEDLRVCLSKELAKNFDIGIYDKSIDNLKDNIKQVKKVGIQYPGGANPIFYVYLVPDDDFVELLSYPYKTNKGGGKPVTSYNLDGYNQAYGLSQNMWSSVSNKPSVSQVVNNIHELSHLVHSQFFYNKNNSYICEGFAEVLPLYVMNYESKFNEHRDILKTLKIDEIFSAKELLTKEKDNNYYGQKTIIPNRSCSFRLSYISSYLFVRVCIEKMISKFDLSKVKSAQKFLEIIGSSKYIDEWLIFELADILSIPRNELLSGKKMQMEVIKGL